jgi:fatty acid desaturase
MPAVIALFKEPKGLLMNGGALLYAVAGYVAGFAGLFHGSWLVNGVATLLLAHAMTIAAYLIHECGHNLVFKRSRHNATLGRAMSWLCGAAYGTYEDMRYKHFRHHVDNDDVVWFEYDSFFERHPLILKIVRALEWLYVPAHDLIMHFVMVFTSFVIPQRRSQRRRNVTVILIRGGIFAALLFVVPKVAILYVVAYLIMMHVLRFMDMVQHDYPYNPTLFEYVEPPHKGDSDWEQEHTFSNPVLHRELTGGDPARVIPFRSQLKLYHRNRLLRVHNPQPADYPRGNDYLRLARAGEGPIGGNAASFLTSF